jgi:hypothetical protein
MGFYALTLWLIFVNEFQRFISKFWLCFLSPSEGSDKDVSFIKQGTAERRA